MLLQEAESKPQCRRLQLKDIIPTEMQRLTKYPLLLENIAKNTGVETCKNWYLEVKVFVFCNYEENSCRSDESRYV